MSRPYAVLLLFWALSTACSRPTDPKPLPDPSRAPQPLRPSGQPPAEAPRGQGAAQGPSVPAPATGLPARCTEPFESGPCKAAFSVYWYDASTSRCEPRIYGGCGGNDNRFEDLESCEAACVRAAR